MAQLDIIGLAKRYGDFHAVRDVSLSIKDGEFLVLLGPSGCGKTTTLRMVAGFIEPTAGHVKLGGTDVTLLPPWKRNAGMVFQNYALFPNMSVAQNIAFPLVVRRLPRATIDEKVQRALVMVRLEGLADRRPQQLSGGQQQRVAVARALVFEPRLVLLDEPLGALDRQLREQMQYELKQLHRRLGVTMVYVTHDQVEAMTMSDRVAVFSTGLLRQVAEPRRLYEEPESLFVAQFLGESNALAATIGRREGAQCVAVLPTGETVVAAAVGACAAGVEVDLVLRPEKVALGAAAQGCANRFAAHVVEATFLGDQLRVRLMTLGREDFVVKVPNAAGQEAIEPGSAVEIGWRVEDCRALAR